VRRHEYHGVGIYSTDTHIIPWLLEEIKKYAPKATYTPLYNINTKQCTLGYFHKLDNYDEAIGWIIVSLLCMRGWEPYAVGDVSQSLRTQVGLYESRYLFRYPMTLET